MEKAILKTLIYADIFKYPLKGYEIHKWLILKQASFQQVLKGLDRLTNKEKIGKHRDYFFLWGHKSQVLKRANKVNVSKKLVLKARVLTQVLKLIPWIKLVGISGGLAMENAGKKDDIDLFIITAKNRLWLSRIFSILLFTLLGVRRARETRSIRGKFCLNAFVSEDNLKQDKEDLYTAHEVLQMRLLWQRGGMYSRYLSDNEWVFKFLPNWTAGKIQNSKFKVQKYSSRPKPCDVLESFARWFQLKIMQKPQGMERIKDGGLYFHPLDYRAQILKEYKLRLKVLN